MGPALRWFIKTHIPLPKNVSMSIISKKKNYKTLYFGQKHENMCIDHLWSKAFVEKHNKK